LGAETGRALLVLRHAKAAREPGMDDMRRPLTRRGHRDAAAAGQWLNAAGLTPGHVLCSPARRTRETWDEVSAALGAAGSGMRPDYDRRAYLADETELLQLVRECPDQAGTVLAVGHNPAAHQLVTGLTGRADLHFPTCALAVIKVAGSWAGLASASGELAGFWSPPARR